MPARRLASSTLSPFGRRNPASVGIGDPHRPAAPLGERARASRGQEQDERAGVSNPAPQLDLVHGGEDRRMTAHPRLANDVVGEGGIGMGLLRDRRAP